MSHAFFLFAKAGQVKLQTEVKFRLTMQELLLSQSFKYHYQTVFVLIKGINVNMQVVQDCPVVHFSKQVFFTYK